MRHKHADLLIYAAENADALFTCYSYQSANISSVLNVPELNWHIKKEPVIEIKYFRNVDGNIEKIYQEFRPNLEKWDLKITYQDGEIIKAEPPKKGK